MRGTGRHTVTGVLGLLMALGSPTRGQAQSGDFSIGLVVAPRLPVFVSDLAREPGLLTVSVTYRGTSLATYEVRLRVRASSGREGRSVSLPLTFAGPGVRTLTNASRELFDDAQVDVPPTWRDLATRGGQLPNDRYEVCAAIYVGGSPVTTPVCANAVAELPPAPVLLAPADRSTSTTLFPTFAWTPSIALGSGVRYVLRVAEVTAQKLPADALAAVPQFEQEVSGRAQLVYPVSALPLRDGATYVWQVQALDASGQPLGVNAGRSPIGQFTVADPARVAERLPVELDRGLLELVALRGAQLVAVPGQLRVTGGVDVAVLTVDGRTLVPAVASGLILREEAGRYVPAGGALTASLPASLLTRGPMRDRVRGAALSWRFGAGTEVSAGVTVGERLVPVSGTLSGKFAGALRSASGIVGTLGSGAVAVAPTAWQLAVPDGTLSLEARLRLFGVDAPCTPLRMREEASRLVAEVACNGAPVRASGDGQAPLLISGIEGTVALEPANGRVSPDLSWQGAVAFPAPVGQAEPQLVFEGELSSEGTRTSRPRLAGGRVARVGLAELALVEAELGDVQWTAEQGWRLAVPVRGHWRVPSAALQVDHALATLTLNGVRVAAVDRRGTAISGARRGEVDGFDVTWTRVTWDSTSVPWQPSTRDPWVVQVAAQLTHRGLAADTSSCRQSLPFVASGGVVDGRLAVSVTARPLATRCRLPMGSAALIVDAFAGRLAGPIAEAGGIRGRIAVRGRMEAAPVRCSIGADSPLPDDSLWLDARGRLFGQAAWPGADCAPAIGPVRLVLGQGVVRADGETGSLRLSAIASAATARGTSPFEADLRRGVVTALDLTIAEPGPLAFPAERPVFTLVPSSVRLVPDGARLAGTHTVRGADGAPFTAFFDDARIDLTTGGMLAGAARIEGPLAFRVTEPGTSPRVVLVRPGGRGDEPALLARAAQARWIDKGVVIDSDTLAISVPGAGTVAGEAPRAGESALLVSLAAARLLDGRALARRDGRQLADWTAREFILPPGVRNALPLPDQLPLGAQRIGALTLRRNGAALVRVDDGPDGRPMLAAIAPLTVDASLLGVGSPLPATIAGLVVDPLTWKPVGGRIVATIAANDPRRVVIAERFGLAPDSVVWQGADGGMTIALHGRAAVWGHVTSTAFSIVVDTLGRANSTTRVALGAVDVPLTGRSPLRLVAESLSVTIDAGLPGIASAVDAVRDVRRLVGVASLRIGGLAQRLQLDLSSSAAPMAVIGRAAGRGAIRIGAADVWLDSLHVATFAGAGSARSAMVEAWARAAWPLGTDTVAIPLGRITVGTAEVQWAAMPIAATALASAVQSGRDGVVRVLAAQRAAVKRAWDDVTPTLLAEIDLEVSRPTLPAPAGALRAIALRGLGVALRSDAWPGCHALRPLRPATPLRVPLVQGASLEVTGVRGSVGCGHPLSGEWRVDGRVRWNGNPIALADGSLVVGADGSFTGRGALAAPAGPAVLGGVRMTWDRGTLDVAASAAGQSVRLSGSGSAAVFGVDLAATATANLGTSQLDSLRGVLRGPLTLEADFSAGRIRRVNAADAWPTTALRLGLDSLMLDADGASLVGVANARIVFPGTPARDVTVAVDVGTRLAFDGARLLAGRVTLRDGAVTVAEWTPNGLQLPGVIAAALPDSIPLPAWDVARLYTRRAGVPMIERTTDANGRAALRTIGDGAEVVLAALGPGAPRVRVTGTVIVDAADRIVDGAMQLVADGAARSAANAALPLEVRAARYEGRLEQLTLAMRASAWPGLPDLPLELPAVVLGRGGLAGGAEIGRCTPDADAPALASTTLPGGGVVHLRGLGLQLGQSPQLCAAGDASVGNGASAVRLGIRGTLAAGAWTLAGRGDAGEPLVMGSATLTLDPQVGVQVEARNDRFRVRTAGTVRWPTVLGADAAWRIDTLRIGTDGTALSSAAAGLEPILLADGLLHLRPSQVAVNLANGTLTVTSSGTLGIGGTVDAPAFSATVQNLAVDSDGSVSVGSVSLAAGGVPMLPGAAGSLLRLTGASLERDGGGLRFRGVGRLQLPSPWTGSDTLGFDLSIGRVGGAWLPSLTLPSLDFGRLTAPTLGGIASLSLGSLAFDFDLGRPGDLRVDANARLSFADADGFDLGFSLSTRGVAWTGAGFNGSIPIGAQDLVGYTLQSASVDAGASLGLSLTGVAWLNVPGVQGHISIVGTRLSPAQGFVLGRVGEDGGSLTLLGNIASVQFSRFVQASGPNASVTIRRASGPAGSSESRDLTIRVREVFELGGASLSIAGTTVGSVREIRFYRTDRERNLVITDAAVELGSYAQASLSMEYASGPGVLELRAAGSATVGSVGAAIAGYYRDRNGRTGAGLFATVMAPMPILPGIVELSAAGAGFFYNPEAEDFQLVCAALGDRGIRDAAGCNLGGPAAFAAFLFGAGAIVGSSDAAAVTGKALLTVSNIGLAIDLTGGRLLGTDLVQVRASIAYRTSPNSQSLSGALHMSSNFGLASGQADVTFLVRKLEGQPVRWSADGEVAMRVVFFSARGRFTASNDGFFAELGIGGGIEAGPIEVTGGVDVQAWYRRPSEGRPQSLGAYAALSGRATLLGVGASARLEGAYVRQGLRDVLFFAGRVSVEVPGRNPTFALGASMIDGDFDAWTGRNAEIEQLVADARAQRGEMQQDIDAAVAALAAAEAQAAAMRFATSGEDLRAAGYAVLLMPANDIITRFASPRFLLQANGLTGGGVDNALLVTAQTLGSVPRPDTVVGRALAVGARALVESAVGSGEDVLRAFARAGVVPELPATPEPGPDVGSPASATTRRPASGEEPATLTLTVDDGRAAMAVQRVQLVSEARAALAEDRARLVGALDSALASLDAALLGRAGGPSLDGVSRQYSDAWSAVERWAAQRIAAPTEAAAVAATLEAQRAGAAVGFESALQQNLRTFLSTPDTAVALEHKGRLIEIAVAAKGSVLRLVSEFRARSEGRAFSEEDGTRITDSLVAMRRVYASDAQYAVVNRDNCQPNFFGRISGNCVTTQVPEPLVSSVAAAVRELALDVPQQAFRSVIESAPSEARMAQDSVTAVLTALEGPHASLTAATDLLWQQRADLTAAQVLLLRALLQEPAGRDRAAQQQQFAWAARFAQRESELTAPRLGDVSAQVQTRSQWATSRFTWNAQHDGGVREVAVADAAAAAPWRTVGTTTGLLRATARPAAQPATTAFELRLRVRGPAGTTVTGRAAASATFSQSPRTVTVTGARVNDASPPLAPTVEWLVNSVAGIRRTNDAQRLTARIRATDDQSGIRAVEARLVAENGTQLTTWDAVRGIGPWSVGAEVEVSGPALADGQSVRLEVRARNGDGLMSNVRSTVDVVRIDLTPPPAPIVTTTGTTVLGGVSAAVAVPPAGTEPLARTEAVVAEREAPEAAFAEGSPTVTLPFTVPACSYPSQQALWLHVRHVDLTGNVGPVTTIRLGRPAITDGTCVIPPAAGGIAQPAGVAPFGVMGRLQPSVGVRP